MIKSINGLTTTLVIGGWEGIGISSSKTSAYIRISLGFLRFTIYFYDLEKAIIKLIANLEDE